MTGAPKRPTDGTLLAGIVDSLPVRLFWKDRDSRFQALFERSPLAIQVVASDGRTLKVNSAWEKLWGVPFESLENYNLLEDKYLIGNGLMPLIKKALAGETVLMPDVEYDKEATPEVPNQGGRLWVHTHIFPLMTENGAVREVVLVHEDVGERKRVERELAEKREQHEVAQQLAHFGHWALDLVENRLAWSDEVYRIFGLAPGTVATYEDFLSCVHPLDVSFVDSAYKESVEKRDPYDIEHRLLMPDGSVKWVQERCKTWYAEDGTPLRSVGTVLDISGRKQAEAELHRAMHNLGERMKELRCLYSLSRLAESEAGSLDEFLRKAVGLLPLGWQYPEITCARILFEGREFRTENFACSRWCLARPIVVNGKACGEVQVCYLKEMPEVGSGPFLEEEKELIEAIAAQLGRIVQQKRSDQKLRENEEKFRTLFESATDGIFLMELDGRFIDFNSVAHERLGYSKEEMLAMRITEVDTPAAASRVPERMEELRQNGEARFESEHRRKDGTAMPVEVNARLIDYERRTVSLAIVRDISERRQAEQALKKKEEELDTILHYAPVIAFYKDRQGRFLRVNRLLSERLGKREDELIGKSAFDLYPPKIARGMTNDDAEVLTTGRSKLGIVEEVETILGRRWVQTDKIPTFGADGEVTGLVGFATDITDRRRAEEQLRQAQKLEAIGTLVGGIAHDFNNMLAAIKGNVYLARLQHRKMAPIEERLDNIEQAATDAAEMVRQLLTFARKEIIATSVFSFNGFLRENEKMIRTLVPENIECDIRLCHKELVVRGDANQLQQVLLNLFSNARDAVAEVSRPRIACGLELFRADESFRRRHPELRQEEFACWSVADNGCGVPEAQLGKIFEPFFTTKEVGKGTGLGLAMAFGTINNHGGVIEVESAEGEGTIFRIYLPISAEAVTTAGESRRVCTEGRGETILLADDEESVRSSTRSVLESLGYKVLEAADGETALQMFGNNIEKVDLLITDVVMPKLSGPDLLLGVREQKSDLPAILVTGYDRGNMLDEHLALERCEVISKPCNFDELSELLRRLLDAA